MVERIGNAFTSQYRRLLENRGQRPGRMHPSGEYALSPEVGSRICEIVLKSGSPAAEPKCKRRELRRLENRHLLLEAHFDLPGIQGQMTEGHMVTMAPAPQPRAAFTTIRRISLAAESGWVIPSEPPTHANPTRPSLREHKARGVGIPTPTPGPTSPGISAKNQPHRPQFPTDGISVQMP